MTHPNRVRLSKLSLGLMVALAAAPVFAQSTSAGVGGQVVGADGQPVPGAEVTITHIASGTVSRATTDAAGRYNARGLRVGGPYTITINKAGAGSDAEENVYLGLDQISQIDLALDSSVTTVGTVVAVASAVDSPFSTDKMGSGTRVSREQLESLPSIARNIQDYIRLDPRIAQTDKERTEISAGGQNSRFNNIRIDGLTINDGFGLESNNLTTARQPVSLDAIEAINISLSNYDVTQSGYTGANVDAVTKAGTNNFTGSLYGIYRDGDWARGDVIPGSFFNPPNKEQTYGATFGGPIVKDKLFFFLAYENFERVLGAPSNLPAAISQAQIDAFRSAGTAKGIDLGDFALPGALAFESEDIMARIDWNISDNHRAYLRYNKTEQAEPFLRNIGSRSLSLSSFWHTNNKTAESLVAQLFSDWSSNFSTELKFGRSETSSLWNLNADLPQIRLCWGANANLSTCSGADSIYAGAEQFRHINILQTKIDSAFAAGTWFTGNHAVKFGAELQRTKALNLFGRDQYGVYVFGGRTFNDALARFTAGSPTRYNVRYPTNGDVSSLAANIELENLGLFIQDTWAVTSNLTLTYGLRYDVPNVPNAPPANPVASAAFGYDNTNTIDGNALLQPRVGFNYNIEASRPTQLRGGIGLFSGAAANVWLANPFQNNGGVTLGEVFNSNGNGIVFSPDVNNQPGIPAAGASACPGTPSRCGGPFDVVDGDLEQPSVWKANLAFEHELPWHGIVGSAEVLLTDVKTGIYYQNLNLGAPSFVSPQDSRLFYWGNPYTGSSFRGNRNTQYTDVTVARPTNKGKGQQLTVSLTKPRVDNWSWGLAYTFTRATDVSPLSSSQAISNWGNAIRLNPNEEVSSDSTYAIRDRFTGNLGYKVKWFGDYATNFTMFYEGRSGRPYSYAFRNDANGDGRTNDLLYVPAGPGDVLFTGGAAMEAAWFAYAGNNPDLAGFAGSVVDTNAHRSPWVNSVDLRVSQELPGFFGGHKTEIWVDVMNFGNLLNKEWGRIEEIGFPFDRGVVSFAGIDRATGKYIYNFNPALVNSDQILRDSRGESRWAMQVGVRYKF